METLQVEERKLEFASEGAQPRRPVWRDVALACSLSTLCLIHAWFGILFNADYGYYNKVPANSAVLLALGANLTLLSLLFWVAGRLVRRFDSKAVRIVAYVTICVLFLIPLNFVRREYWGIRGADIIDALGNPVVWIVIALATAALIKWHRLFGRVALMIGLILSPLAILVFGNLAFHLAARAAGHDATPIARIEWRDELHEPQSSSSQAFPKSGTRVTRPSTSGPRVVWILFDELEQRIGFSERPKGIALPEMDRVQKDAVYALNAFPPGGSTALSIPSLTLGQTVVATRIVSASELALTVEGAGTELHWAREPSLFSKAQALGARTAAVGWFHPYSRIFGDALDFCTWYPYPPFEQARGETFTASFVHQLWSLLTPLQQRRLQVQLYQRSTTDALRLVTDPTLRLILLHLPVPHTPGIYDPATGKMKITSFSRPKGYLNNLVLMDKTLGQLRQAMEKAGTWQNTWLIISSDHWWRDAHEYDGKLDYRVPFLVKAPPGAAAPAEYAREFSTVVTAELMLAILRGEVTSTPSVISWLDAHQVPAPKTFASPGNQ